MSGRTWHFLFMQWCRLLTIELGSFVLFGKAGAGGSDSKQSWEWESLPPGGVFWCKQPKKKKGKNRKVCFHPRYSRIIAGEIATQRELVHWKCIPTGSQYKNTVYLHLKKNQWELNIKQQHRELLRIQPWAQHRWEEGHEVPSPSLGCNFKFWRAGTED